jgi:hypothetical protein
MSRRDYYLFVIAALTGMILGLLELGYRLIVDADPDLNVLPR